MKVVIDANVFVSAAIQKGASHRIVHSWLTGETGLDLVICPQLIAEVRDVLTTRPRLRKWINLEDAVLFVDAIETVVDLVDDPQDVASTTCDVKDDYLVALANAHDGEMRGWIRPADVGSFSGSASPVCRK